MGEIVASAGEALGLALFDCKAARLVVRSQSFGIPRQPALNLGKAAEQLGMDLRALVFESPSSFVE